MSETSLVPLQELSASRIAVDMTPTQVELLAQLSEFKTYADGEVILGDREHTHSLVVLLSGKAQIQGTFMQEITMVEAGTLLGELSFLDKKPRSATVRSVGESKCAILTEPLMARLRTENPEIVAAILHNIALALAEKLRSATRMVNALSAAL